MTIAETVGDDSLAKAGRRRLERGRNPIGDPIGGNNFFSHKFVRQASKKRVIQAWNALRERLGGCQVTKCTLMKLSMGSGLAERAWKQDGLG